MSLTTDPHDCCLHEIGSDGMQQCYLILADGQRRDLVRPLRLTYVHEKCGAATTMARPLAETYAAQPNFYGSTFCVGCRDHFPVGEAGEFVWEDGTKVGS